MVSEEFMDEIIESEIEQMDENCEKRISGAQEIISSQCDEIEQLKAENERLNKLAEGISAREESIYAEHKLRIEIESENEALKSKLKIAKTALEMASNYMDQHGQDATYYEAIISEIGGEI